MKYKMHGCIPPMITPFDKEGNVDIESLKKLVHFLDGKVHGIFICGSYGSGPMMSVEDRKLVAELCKKESKNLQIIAMTGTTNTKDSIDLTLHAKKIGLDAASAVVPYYFHHNMDDVIGYYTDILNAIGTEFPFYIYTNPKFSGYAVDIDTMKKLKIAGVSGVKAASFDIMEFAGYMRELKDDNFDVVLGTESLWLPASVYGGKAFIPGLANAFPEICVQMFEESQRGDYEACKETQFRINELREVMYLAKSTQLAVYAMLEIRGIISSYPKKPFTKAEQKDLSKIKAKLIEMGMLS